MQSARIGDWLFRLGDDPEAWKKRADESAYRPVRVPHDWAVEYPFEPECSSGTGYLPGGIGWYRAHCSVDGLGLAEAGLVRLVFHGVYKNAQVWVNGYHLGGRPSGYAEFTFDLTEIVGYAPDDDLVISVRVDHRDLADSRWYNGSGLTRWVEIETHEPVTVARHGSTVTTLAASSTSAAVQVVQRLENHSGEDRRVVVEHTLEPVEYPGRPVHRRSHTVEIPARGVGTVRDTITVTAPALWSDERPSLYRLVTMITDGAGTGRHEQTVGIRTVRFDADTGFWVNHEQRTLRGVCLHEDAGPLGTAVPAEVWLRRLLTLKEAGCNAVRMAHNPHAPELYELCDVLGLYVIDEAFDEWENPKNKWWQGHNVYPPKHQGYAHDYPAWHIADLTAMVTAHRRHPSVIAWSIGNEIDYPNDPYASELFDQMTGNNDASKPEAERVYDPDRPDVRRLTTLADELIDVVRQHDPSRAVTFAAAFPELSSRTGLLDRLDLVGYNYKEHLYAEDHRRFPSHPLLGSENGHGYQQWRAVVDQEFVAGQFLWTGVDFLGETPGWPSHGSAAGLLTTAGFPKQRWHLRRSWWTDDPFVRIAVRPADADPHTPFGRDWQPGTAIEVACFASPDRTTSMALTSAGAPVIMTFDPEAGYWRGTVTPDAGPLVAVATVDGTEVQDELRSSCAPASLAATVWTVPDRWHCALDRVRRSGADALVHQIECQLLDHRGEPVEAAMPVEVEVGAGTLLGLDNGDLRDPTPYPAPRRATSGGRLLVYLRGAGATVTLRPEGLSETIVHVPSLPTDPMPTEPRRP